MIYVSFIFIVSNFHSKEEMHTQKLPQIKRPGKNYILRGGVPPLKKQYELFRSHATNDSPVPIREICMQEWFGFSNRDHIPMWWRKDLCAYKWRLFAPPHTRNKVRSIICLKEEREKVTYNEGSKVTPITAWKGNYCLNIAIRNSQGKKKSSWVRGLIFLQSVQFRYSSLRYLFDLSQRANVTAQFVQRRKFNWILSFWRQTWLFNYVL